MPFSVRYGHFAAGFFFVCDLFLCDLCCGPDCPSVEMRAPDALLLRVALLLLLLTTVRRTLAPDSHKSKSKTKESALRGGPQDQDVFDLGLVSPEPLAKDIVSNHRGYFKETGLRRFNGTTLGYVTPVSRGRTPTFCACVLIYCLLCL